MSWFRPNIQKTGRLVRAAWALFFLSGSLAGYFFLAWPLWPCLLLAAGSVFCAFEALRGWCLLRACGIKTPL